ncbi:MAG: hypothetical protein PHS02_00950 [Candidatus ainarchaeum sp.]|nr:hypothetical protein [Candidatus ainarchaeum sp.]
MLPEGKLIRSEMVLREMALSDDVKLTRKSLVRWIALSLGLISPNESRTIILDVLEALINLRMRSIQPTTKEILEELASMEVAADEKSVYYHLLRMKESGLIGKRDGKHFFGDGEEARLSQVIKRIYQSRFDKSFSSVDQALDALEGYKR